MVATATLWAQSAVMPDPNEANATGPGYTKPIVQSLAVDPTNPNAIYAGTNVGVYKSTNGGATFVEVSNGMNINAVGGPGGGTSPTTSVPSSCNFGQVIQVTSGTAISPGLYGCYNASGGGSYSELRTLLISVNSLAFDPQYSSRVWAATNFGLWLSTNGGGSWTWVKIFGIDPTTQQPYNNASDFAPVEVNMSSVAVDATGVVWAARSGNALYYSPNSGGTWYTWPTAASFDPTKSAYDATKPWGAASIGSKAATNIVVDNTTTPPTIYVGAGSNGFYSWQCTTNCRGSLELSPIDGSTPIALFTQSATSGINQASVNRLVYNPLIGIQAGGTAPNSEAFVAELDPTGSKLLFLTYLGGTGGEDGWAIYVDAKGNIYTAGQTSSSSGTGKVAFPSTKGAYTTSAPGGRDGFVTVYKP